MSELEWNQVQDSSGTLPGSRIKLQGNVINLELSKDKIVYCYAVYFLKRLLPEQFRISAVNAFVNKYGNDSQPEHHIYNGKLLFLCNKLSKNVIKFEIPETQESSQVLNKNVKMCVMYRSKRTLNRCSELLKYIARTLPKMLGYKSLHKIFYDPSTCKLVSELELCGGYRIHLAQTERPGLIIDCLHCYRQTRTVYDVWKSFEDDKISVFKTQKGEGDDVVTSEQHDDGLNKLREYCLGRPIVNDDIDQLYEIADITWNKDRTAPLLWVWTKACLVEANIFSKTREVCIPIDPKLYRVPATRLGYPPNGKQNADNRRLVMVSPHVRVEAVFRVLELIAHNQQVQNLLHSWDIKLDKNMVSFYGHVIPSPKVEFGGRNIMKNASKLFWDPKTDAPNIKVYGPIHFEDWLVFCQQHDANEAKRIVQTMRIKSSTLGIRIRGMGSVISVPTRFNQICAFVDSVRQHTMDSKPQFVIVILPNVSRTVEQELYGQLKKLCSVELKIVSQMVRIISLKKINRTLLVASLLTQINVKLGGSLWAIHIPTVALKHEKVMFIGMDVWHGSLTKTFSVAAMVCTLNSNCTKFYTTSLIHDFRQETFYQIQFEFQLALAAFFEENGQLPDRIMVFRDGVHRREYARTLNIEVESFIAAIIQVYEDDPKPSFSVIICQKRIYERFFVQKNGKYVNPPVGTLIDNTLTRNKSYDFFLISMYKRKGTVIPSHYVVLYDNSKLSPDAVHEITNALCYAYFNWPGSFYIPCVVQYAHKLAAFVGKCEALPSVNLENQLHFL